MFALVFLLLAPSALPIRSGVSADHPHQPACELTFADTGRLQITGGPSLEAPAIGEAPFCRAASPLAFVVWPAGPGHVLLTREWRWEIGTGCPPVPDGVLDRVDCRTGERTAFVPTVAGRDYANAALAADGRTLYYSGPQGVERLDLKTRQSTPFTRRPERECFSSLPDSPLDPVQERDIVEGLSPDGRRLLVLRGHMCGAHDCGAFWTADPLDLQVSDPKQAQPGHPMQAVVTDAGGAVFAVDGGLWRQHARRWARLATPTRYGVQQLVASARQPGKLLLLGRRFRPDPGDMTDLEPPDVGAHLWRSLDGGGHWTRLPDPPGESPSALRWAPDGEIQASSWKAVWATRDLGRTWRQLTDVTPFLPAMPAEAKVGRRRYLASRAGLWVVDAPGATPRQVALTRRR